MPITNMKQPVSEKPRAGVREPGVFRNSHSKAPGMRVGTIEDWREGSQKSGKNSGLGKTIRDGR